MIMCTILAITILLGVYGFISIITDAAEMINNVKEDIEAERIRKHEERIEDIKRFARQATKHYQAACLKRLTERKVIFGRGWEVDQ